ncbi:MAG: AAA family ATPase, partial [Acidimicrobiia bacterium]|nr:AAA family ATPase [Acidimicrobiia bacterium]
MRRAPQRFDGDLLEGARTDVGIFAEALIGERLWKHQLEVARSPERVRVVNSGRQAGKSRTLAVLALHEAYSGPERRVLVLSAGEDAAKELLRHVGGLCSSPLLAGSVVDENASVVRLSNGSEIRSVPASEKQVRGRSVDLLILDEAAFIDDAIWTAARFTVIARPGSRVVMASTPYGRTDRFFSVAYRTGERKEQGYRSFHWPSTVSPMVDREWLALQRKTMTDREYRAEVLAEWVDDSGAYFTSAELEGAVEDYELVDPSVAMGTIASGGVDWGLGDANAVALVGRPRRSSAGFTLLATGRPGYEPQERPKDPLRVLWLEEHFGMPY